MIRLAAFDMDGTLLAGRVIVKLAEHFGFGNTLAPLIDTKKIPGYIRSQKVAGLLKGFLYKEAQEVIASIPFSKNTIKIIEFLKSHKVITGIISDSYTFATEFFKEKLGMDFTIANTLEVENGYFTGEVKMPMGFKEAGCSCQNSVCKHFALTSMAKKYNVSLKDCMAVGDNIGDICMLKIAGFSVGFNPKRDEVKNYVDYVCEEDFMELILKLKNLEGGNNES